LATRRLVVAPASAAPEPLYRDIRAVLEQARASAWRAVNAAMVQACWQAGRLIAKYSVLNEASQIFAAKYIHGLPTEQELKREIERERR
jgi:hypothetical protein